MAQFYVGFDYGTTYSEIAAVDGDHPLPRMVSIDQKQQMPTVFYDGDKVSVGMVADNWDRLEPDRVLKWFKPKLELEPNAKFRDLSLAKITEHVLAKMKEHTEAELNLPSLDEVLITVPAWFHDPARKTVKEAAFAAGFKEVYLENEPTAAAFYCHLQQPLSVGDILLVYDLGGGTFDTSIVELLPDHKLKVLASSGDMDLGGHRWTLKLQEYVAPKYKEQFGKDLTNDATGRYDLYRACEECKRQLTVMPDARVIVKPEEGERAEYLITREEFEKQTKELLKTSREVMNDALRSAKKSWDQVTQVLLVGGATKMPQVEEFLKTQAGEDKLRKLGDRDHVVAQGASLLLRHMKTPTQVPTGSVATGSKVLVRGIIRTVPHSLSTWIRENNQLVSVVMVPKGAEVRAEGQKSFMRNKPQSSEIEIPIFQGGRDNEIIDLKKAIAEKSIGFMTKWKFSGIPRTQAEPDEIQVTFAYEDDQTIDVKAVYKPGTDEETPLTGVEDRQWADAWKDLDMDDNLSLGGVTPLIVAIDCSGSMYGKAFENAKSELNKIAQKYCGSGCNLSIVAFPHRIFGDCHVVVQAATDVEPVRRAVGDLIAGGGTPMGPALEKCHEVMQSVGEGAERKYIILITDGKPHNRPAVTTAAKKIKDSKMKLFGIPIGSSADVKLIQSICEEYEEIETSAGISSAFDNLVTRK